jgi:hypothetical protein
MKNEIPARRTTAPIAIATIPPPPRLPPPVVVVIGATVGVVAVGVGGDDGSPGLKGLAVGVPPWASEAGGSASTPAARTSGGMARALTGRT